MRTVKYFVTFLVVFFSFCINSYSQTYNVPEILYYKFNTGTSTTPNLAVPGQGSADAVLTGMTMGPGGQFANALMGNGGTASVANCNSGWNMNTGTGSWTISLWISGIPNTGTQYLFGNDFTTSFRCFTNGGAGSGNITLRGFSAATFANVDVTGILPGSNVVHFVYDAAVPEIRVYVNGLFRNAVTQPVLNINATVPFKVGTYGTASSLPVGGLIDEFRFYSRPVGAAEIAATWNVELPYTVTGTGNQNSNLPESYHLSQNYPNPFNPGTKINYELPVANYVSLKVYNELGMIVADLVNQKQAAGTYSIDFNTNKYNLPSGMYFYKLEAGNFVDTKKMILVK